MLGPPLLFLPAYWTWLTLSPLNLFVLTGASQYNPVMGVHSSRTGKELGPTLLHSPVLAVALPEEGQGKLGIS